MYITGKRFNNRAIAAKHLAKMYKQCNCLQSALAFPHLFNYPKLLQLAYLMGYCNNC